MKKLQVQKGKERFATAADGSGPSEVSKTLQSNYISTSENKVMRVLDWEKEVCIAETCDTAVWRKQENIGDNCITQTNRVHGGETGKEGLRLEEVSFKVARSFFMHHTHTFDCCRDNFKVSFLRIMVFILPMKSSWGRR